MTLRSSRLPMMNELVARLTWGWLVMAMIFSMVLLYSH